MTQEQAAAQVPPGSGREKFEMKKVACRELFTEAPAEECFSANLKEGRMFNI